LLVIPNESFGFRMVASNPRNANPLPIIHIIPELSNTIIKVVAYKTRSPFSIKKNAIAF
jgi:hypothetical protein